MHTVFVATWQDGLYRLADGDLQPELPQHSVQGLAEAGGGGMLAILDGHSLHHRGVDGNWSTLAATREHELYCCVAVGAAIYVGTSDAQLLRLSRHDTDGALVPLPGFMRVPGRERWYAGTAVIDGHVVGPPLGVRTLAATCDGRALLANIHVGGIARSGDGGATWQPTIDIDSDVHQVCVHPTRPEWVAAAAAAGLCLSRDGGRTWNIEHDGLHASYCSAVAFAGDQVLVAASSGHFAAEGAIYRRALERPGFTPLCGTGGLPRWLDGIADTGNIAARGELLVLADHGGHLYLSADAGRSWQRAAEGLAVPVGVFISGR